MISHELDIYPILLSEPKQWEALRLLVLFWNFKRVLKEIENISTLYEISLLQTSDHHCIPKPQAHTKLSLVI